MPGSAARKPANEARNSGSRWFSARKMSMPTKGTSARAPIFWARRRALCHDGEHLVDGQLGPKRLVVESLLGVARSGDPGRRQAPR